MDLVQSRIVTDDVERLVAFYARLVRVSVVLNDYYVEVPTGAASVGFSPAPRLGVAWVMPPATQLWGCRTMIFRDPAGNLVNVSSTGGAAPG